MKKSMTKALTSKHAKYTAKTLRILLVSAFALAISWVFITKPASVAQGQESAESENEAAGKNLTEAPLDDVELEQETNPEEPVEPLLGTTSTNPADYSAEIVSAPTSVDILPGQRKLVSVTMRNTGVATWVNDTGPFVALNLTNPAPHDSEFFDAATWTEYYFRPTRLDTPSVAPGETGVFDFYLQAPTTKGSYTEYFQVVSEHVTWIPGSYFELEINVDAPYEGQFVDKSHSLIYIEDTGAREVWVKIRNTGSKTWPAGRSFVATSNPLNRTSQFQDDTWGPYPYIATVLDHDVAPGQTGTYRFLLRAPETPGNYTESFRIRLAGGITVQGTDFNFYPRVLKRYQAEVQSTSAAAITMEPNAKRSFTAYIKNTGTRTWKNTGPGFIALNAIEPVGRQSAFQDTTWPLYFRPTLLDEPSVVAPGQVGRFTFWLKAPPNDGNHTERFQLVSEHVTFIEGADFGVDIEVKDLKPEPKLRIGIYTGNQVVVTGDGPFRAKRGTSNLVIGNYNAGEEVTVEVPGGAYYRVTAVNTNHTTSEFVRFEPIGDTILEFENYEDRPGWNPSLNDNTFRGNLIAHRSGETGNFWAINEIHMEDYLKGVAEQSNSTHPTHLRTMATIERTYAQYHFERGGKHPQENIHLKNHSGDQVYKGYNFELRSPNVALAVQDTEGLMVTKNGDVVVTPYFSRTDGRTRSWSEVWNGSYDHLITVPDPWSGSGPMLGHGVGLSAYGAVQQAFEGKSSEEILKYYYTGISLSDFY